MFALAKPGDPGFHAAQAKENDGVSHLSTSTVRKDAKHLVSSPAAVRALALNVLLITPTPIGSGAA
jgi:hypothetical protein